MLPTVPDITAWRLVTPRHGGRREAFSGEGARLFGGRWNSPGIPVVYSSSSLSLAALETLVHADRRRFSREYVAFKLYLPEELTLELRERDLPKDWRARVVSAGARQLGDAWAETRASVVLSVPSVIVPVERNFLLNPLHPEFSRLVIDPSQAFRFDARLAERNL